MHQAVVRMPRIELIPTVTADGRRIIFRAVEVPAAERLRRALRRLGLPPRRPTAARAVA